MRKVISIFLNDISSVRVYMKRIYFLFNTLFLVFFLHLMLEREENFNLHKYKKNGSKCLATERHPSIRAIKK